MLNYLKRNMPPSEYNGPTTGRPKQTQKKIKKTTLKKGNEDNRDP